MKEKIFEIINIVLANNSKPTIAECNPALHLRNDLNMDSFNLAELTVRIEDAYGIDIFEEQMVNTIGEIFQILEKSGK